MGANASSFEPARRGQPNKSEITVMARISVKDGIVRRSHPA